MSLPPRPLYFWHIPKTGGFAFGQWLETHFSSEDVFSPTLLSGLDEAERDVLRGRLLYRGHFASKLPQELGAPVGSITLLRAPRARTLSHLNHIWRDPGHYLHDRLRRRGPSLAAALNDPVLRRAVSDVQARYLAVDPSQTRAAILPIPVPEHLYAQAQFELAQPPSTLVLVRNAVLRLLRMTDYGFAEELQTFAERVARRQRWATPRPLPRVNEAPIEGSPWQIGRLTGAELGLLDGVNRADHGVYGVSARTRRVLPFLHR